VFAVLVISGVAQAAEPGNLWQIQTSMEMAGMKMPGQNRQVCAPVTAEGPEAMAGGDSECTMSNVQHAAGKFSYDVTCPQGSGSGEMIYQGRDSYTMTMNMTSDGQAMKMVTHGKRLGGTCDAGAVKKQVAAAQAQATAGMAQACAGMVDGLMPGNLQTYECDAKYKHQLCRKFDTREGFGTVAQRPTTGQAAIDSGTLPEVARFCGVDANALRTRFCGEASRSEDLEFLGANCPAQAQVIAQRECAGRSFSSPAAPKYQGFCGTYARAMMQGGASGDEASQAAPATSPPTEAIQEGAKRLKGMLGF
jgi:hypothetical protein